MRIFSRRETTTTRLLLATALFTATLPAAATGTKDLAVVEPQTRQSPSGTAHDTLCSDVMCVECSIEGSMARYVLRTTGEQKLGWMAIGFGRYMANSPMVVVWPSRGEDGNYNSVTISQRKAPYETMPTLDPHPPFTARLSKFDTWVTVDNPQITFTRPAPPDGVQDIIWAFSRTPPESSNKDSIFSIHHRIGRGSLNLTRIPPLPPHPPPPLPPPPPFVHHHSSQPHTEEAEDHDDHGDGAEVDRAGFVHGALCMAGFLLVVPFGALVARYAKVAGSSRAFRLHRILQFGLAGAFIAGGTLAYFFMDNHHHDSSIAHKVGGTGLVLLYVLQCAIGRCVHRIPSESRTPAQSALLAGLGALIVLLAFVEAWGGLFSAGRSTSVWSALLFVVPVLYVLGVMMVQRRYGGTREKDVKGEYVALDMRAPPDDGLEDDEEKL